MTKPSKPPASKAGIKYVRLKAEGQAFLKKLFAAGYSETEIKRILSCMEGWMMNHPCHFQGSFGLNEELRHLIESLLERGHLEDQILDALNRVALLLINRKRTNHEH